ncbi:hypothetical protein PCANC_02345 [Puccinia coronata f. sp. avenae]|uniref:CxC1-like cysteine cluster associated with KDZ transposases domain-containing protein n=1 Tax=Puccinia coronata f. sp. avenae TaxID=200324 RepID=A0A2N5VZE3_9BASI|nr:hypothetical protein PCANC_02345 [Puccinia coronata f. sp. avenae]
MKLRLEERSPPLLTALGKSCDFRTNFSATVDIYRNLMNWTDSMANEVLDLTKQERLARDTCPACFGKSMDLTNTPSPLIICLDGNFQQRHHAAASKNYHPLMTPDRFVQPEAINAMDATIGLHEQLNQIRPTTDKCADAHTAADDKRNNSTWKACDDTGLMGCCCRHDAVVSLANITGGGEKRKYPLAILQQRNMFSEHQNCLTFGTSVFHSYVHNWKCQIEFSPRFNDGWGLSDGEGLERLWSFLSSLISSLRYSTRNHRLSALAHKVSFHNERGILQLVQWLRQKYRIASSKRLDAEKILGSLAVLRNPFDTHQGTYTSAFLKSQWINQVNFQKSHNDTETEENEQLAAFLDQEATLTRLRSELNGMVDLFNPSAYNRILEMVQEFAMAEEQQRAIARNLGGVPAHLTGSDDERKARLLVWHAKSKLYVHAVELYAERQPLNRGTPVGTTLTTRILAAMDRRKKPIQALLKKFNLYRTDYLTRFAPSQLNLPENQPLTYHTFSNLSLDHSFWQDVYLYHSREPWALSADVRKGIQAILIVERTSEEMVMIKQELKNAMSWAVGYHEKLSSSIHHIEAQGGEEFNALAEWLPAVKLGDIDNTAKTKLVLPVLTDQIAEHNEAPQAVDGGNNADADDVVEMLDPADVMAMLNLGAGDNNAGGNTDNNNVNP